MNILYQKITNRIHEISFWKRFDNFWDILTRSIAARYRMVGLYDLESGPVIVDRAAADPNGIWACLFWWEYEGAISVLEDFFSDPMPLGILDCGANIGGFGLLLTSRGVKIREYHAVEMNPRTFGRLAYNLTNWRTQLPARVTNAALADQEGWVKINDTFGDDSQSLFAQAQKNGESGQVWVHKTTLHTLLDASQWKSGLPELIKLDVEGSEFDAIYQLDRNLLSGTKAIVMEVHGNRSLPASGLIDHLESLSFECILRPQGEWGVYVFRLQK